jgi:hypothetical protein
MKGSCRLLSGEIRPAGRMIGTPAGVSRATLVNPIEVISGNGSSIPK